VQQFDLVPATAFEARVELALLDVPAAGETHS
jgi:hypothetical protein